MLLYGSRLPEQPTFAATFDGEQERTDAVRDLENARYTFDLYARNANQRRLATIEAYEQRIREIHEATGVQIENPAKTPENSVGPRGERIIRTEAEEVSDWRRALEQVAAAHPDKLDVIGLDRPIEEDALRITRESQQAYEAARGRAEAAGAGGFSMFGAELKGSVGAMLRDPLQVTTLLAGGGPSTGRTVVARLLERFFTEAAINGGVEAAVQVSAQDWRRRAGLEHGITPALREVGLAALFGGGFGGLVQGGSEVFRALGRAAPEDALARIAAEQPQPEDVASVAHALGLDVDPQTLRAAQLAAEQPDLDAAAFGPAPAITREPDAELLAAEALRAAETPAEGPPPIRDPQDRAEQIERIVRQQYPIGRRPRRPQTLLEFLSAQGGLRDDAGELAARDLGKWRRSGYRKLLQDKGRTLDLAREIAEEAGYLGRLGDYQTSTVDDLLQAIDDELHGTPRYSVKDGELLQLNQAYDDAVRGRQAYRNIVEEVDGAISTLGLEHQIDDRLLIRAAELVDDETDPVAALERAIEEDYRQAADDLAEAGEGLSDEFDIPFFADEVPDAGAMPARGSQTAGGSGETAAGDGDPTARDREQPAGLGRDEGAPLELAAPPLKPVGSAAEPSTQEAADLAALALSEARSERTAAGEQLLLGDVRPVSERERLEADAAKPLRGGEEPPPEGGLFDENARKQPDLWDALPAAKEADGTIHHVTYGDMVQDAERDDFLADLISSCKD